MSEFAVTGCLHLGRPQPAHNALKTQTPKSAYDKVLLGRLNGIDSILGTPIPAVEDIGQRITELLERHPDIAAVPTAALTEAIQSYQPLRRRGRRG